jgi:hypothetical protein
MTMQLIRDLDAELDDLEKELETRDSESEDSNYAQQIFVNGLRAHRLVVCKERCETQIQSWHSAGANGIDGTDFEHLILLLTERHERASRLLLRYRESLRFYLLEYGTSATAQSELKGELDKYCQELQRLNETDNASQASKDEALMMAELLKDVISKN